MHLWPFAVVAALPITFSSCHRDLPIELESPSFTRGAERHVPPRSEDAAGYFLKFGDDELWRVIAANDSLSMVGLKVPGRARGVYLGEILIDPGAKAQAVEQLLSVAGVSITRRSMVLPVLTLKLDSRQALQRVRQLPFIDYVEPIAHVIPNEVNLGCGANDPWSAALETSWLGDAMPWYYTAIPVVNLEGNDIVRAWARSQGDNVRVAVLDTGLDPNQHQFGPAFHAGWSRELYIAAWDGRPMADGEGADNCGHGTRIAGAIAAPHDGSSMVGIGWKSDLLTMEVNDDVVNDGSKPFYAIEWAAYVWGAKIIEMAFKAESFGLQPWTSYPEPLNPSYASLADAIRYYYHNSAYDVLFIGAAGTGTDNHGIENVYFPAELPEVVAVVALNAEGHKDGSSNWGDEVEFGGYVDVLSTGATGLGQPALMPLGGSSGGSAAVAGIAALIRGRYPTWTNEQIRARMKWAAQRQFLYEDNKKGYGSINAYKAVGGFMGVSLRHSYCYSDRVQAWVVPDGDGPFAYSWSNGAATSTTTYPRSGPQATVPVTITVTDQVENKARNTSGSLCDPANLSFYIEGPTGIAPPCEYVSYTAFVDEWPLSPGPFTYRWDGLVQGTGVIAEGEICSGGIVSLEVTDANGVKKWKYITVTLMQ